MRAALIVVVTGTVIALSGCTADPPSAPQADSTAPVLAPGRPGEQARTLAPGEAVTAVPKPVMNAADVKYLQDMVVHHQQALDMSILVPNRATSARIKALASRIKDTQGPEIQFMRGLLQEQGQRIPDHHTAHEGMPGMATPEQLDRLKAASGQAFDEQFLQLMSAHHEGAIKMSEQVLTGGSHIRIEELANDIAVTQLAEIRRMRQIQAGG
ncbi:DUF305 domain-containing protein [Nonomuraea glycinis]|uniref:Lipoprotein n=1 Tax=Nonomuraea glycinis TaxID=2047744 RepID=A0A918A643_9ACTN|nr:DUF305 domain-containing protein [Nonomuraea glycinis]MCA2175964.1 DUF305 domain-containing protein [Nonomuraea glycinis]GGP05745.1 lipoprotein [Nonomuraea glycinis]